MRIPLAAPFLNLIEQSLNEFRALAHGRMPDAPRRAMQIAQLERLALLQSISYTRRNNIKVLRRLESTRGATQLFLEFPPCAVHGCLVGEADRAKASLFEITQ